MSLATTNVVCIDPAKNSQMLNEKIFEQFHIRSQMFMAIHPKIGKPWLLGIHHCAQQITYSQSDCDLFQTLGNRISDGLSNLISWHNSKRLFENTEVSIWNEDMSQVYKTLEQLRHDGIENLRKHLEDNQQLAWNIAAQIKVIHVNQATLSLFEAKNESEFLIGIHKVFTKNSIQIFIDELCAIWAKEKIFRREATFQTFSGKTIYTIISFRIPDSLEEFESIPVSIIDITEQKKADQMMRGAMEAADRANQAKSEFWQ